LSIPERQNKPIIDGHMHSVTCATVKMKQAVACYQSIGPRLRPALLSQLRRSLRRWAGRRYRRGAFQANGRIEFGIGHWGWPALYGS